MQRIDGTPVFSPTDLVAFLACEHLTALERAALHGLVQRPHLTDPVLDVLHRRGLEHEKRYLDALADQGRAIVTITHDGSIDDHGERLRAAAQATIDAMAGGAGVVYQATFFDGGWRGHADFLLRVDDPARPSRFGAFHYEVVDTKLARHVKPGAVLQLCSYVDRLTALQGVEPERMSVALGGSARRTEPLRVRDFMAYYRAVKDRFHAAVGPDAPPPAFPPPATYPEPVAHCDVCRWRLACDARRRADDHLSLVAGSTTHQRTALAARGVTTLGGLGTLPLPVDPPIDGIGRNALLRVREQARLQLEGRSEKRPKYELLCTAGQPVEPNIGLGALPDPTPDDLFLDLEGDPYAGDDGIDYLFGILESDGTYHPLWSTDDAGDIGPASERRAFERCIDFLIERLDRNPSLHVFHFGHYERTALGRLMGRHGTREDAVDRLLRGGVLVDLHRVVRQSLRASVESYSLKKLEPLYAFKRTTDLREAGSSIALFEEWLQLGEGVRPAADHLTRIADYNRDDTVSTARLRDWLESLRAEAAAATGHPVPRGKPAKPEPDEKLGAELEEIAQLADQLTADVPADPVLRTPEQQARWLLAQLLPWHRREEKSFWWRYFYLVNDLTDAERIEEPEPLAGLTYQGEAGREKRSIIHRYAFPPQEHGLWVGCPVRDPATGKLPGTLVAIDDVDCTIDLKRGAGSQVPHPTALIPWEYYGTNEQRRALRRLARSVIQNGIAGDGPDRAARDLLLRRPPRVGQEPNEPLRRAGENATQAARRLSLALDRTTFAIQGPPGAGKTYTGARMILDLVRAGRRVGVTANSHKVIGNLLDALCSAADQERQPLNVVQKCDEDEQCEHPMVRGVRDNAAVLKTIADGTAQVVAGTPWLWAREDMANAVDVLVVDEAGQMSLANALAVAGAARSLVLLGDPQQLDQPRKGVHPPGAERSALEHLLGDAATMPPERGLFMETTRRLHPDVCRFTSELFYDSRLTSEPELSQQALRTDGPLAGTGLRFVAVEHTGNDVESAEEAETVAALARELVSAGAAWIDQTGCERRLGWEHVVIVAPYNAQVAAIERLLPAQARVGTVDKFQGQDAAVSIYSMASSTADDAPRGMSFLYSRHRLNVATSRARCVAVIVASPALLRARAGTPEQMRLANALCRFKEMA